jgi:anti-sigma regulatory factor (Ser/Thr protein kinase)
MKNVVQSLSHTYPAVSASVPSARAALSAFAARAGAAPEQVGAVRLASSEALTNSVLHAYRDSPGLIHVTAAVVADELWVLIADDGEGLEPRADRPGLGLGLGLIAQLTDDFAVGRRSCGGTEVSMRFDLVGGQVPDSHGRGSSASAIRPASPRFSTTM